MPVYTELFDDDECFAELDKTVISQHKDFKIRQTHFASTRQEYMKVKKRNNCDLGKEYKRRLLEVKQCPHYHAILVSPIHKKNF